jgi:hypothetical protein
MYFKINININVIISVHKAIGEGIPNKCKINMQKIPLSPKWF